MGRVLANGPEDRGSIPGHVITKTQKMVFDAAWHYKLQMKGKVEKFRERRSTPQYLGVVALEKGVFGSHSTMDTYFTLYIWSVVLYFSLSLDK